MDDALTPALLAFFDSAPEEFSLACALLEGILAACPGSAAVVQKTQITLKGRHVFAALSLPRRSRDRKAHRLTLTLGLARRLDSPGWTWPRSPTPAAGPTIFSSPPGGPGRPHAGLDPGGLCLR